MRRSGEAIRTFQSRLAGAIGVADASAARAASRSWRRAGVGLIILCLLVYIPGLWQLPPIDRDESRFAQASRQMLESGTLQGWVVPMVQDRPRLNKPPLIYWLQATSAWVLGDAPGQWAWLDGGSENVWVYRVPSVLCAMLTVLLTWRIGVRMFDPRAAVLGAALLAVCPMVVWDAHQARADQLLLAMTTGTMLALWRVWSVSGVHHGDTEARRREMGEGDSTHAFHSVPPRLRGESSLLWPLAFWLFLALGIMTKGPITPMIAGLTCLALCLVSRRWRWLLALRPAMGLPVVLAVVGPWVYLVGQEVGWSNYLTIIYDETIGRSAGAKEGHWGPPGYHIVLLGVLFWPGSLLTAAAIGRAWRRAMTTTHRNRERERAKTHDDTEAPAERHAPLRSRFRHVVSFLRDARPSRPAELFLLAWMLPSWIVFELVSTKLPHYTMPLYPAVALISARALFGVRQMFLPANTARQRGKLREFLATRDIKCPQCSYNLRGLHTSSCPECRLDVRTDGRRLLAGARFDLGFRLGHFVWTLLGAVMVIGIPLAAAVWKGRILSSFRDPLVINWHPVVLPGLVAAALGFILLNAASHFIRRERFVGGTIIAAASLATTFAWLFIFIIPATREIRLSPQVVSVLRANGWKPGVRVACIGYTEDSLLFLTRGAAERVGDPREFEQRMWAREFDFYVWSEASWIGLPATIWWPVVPLDHVGGFNYSKGRHEWVTIMKRNDERAPTND